MGKDKKAKAKTPVTSSNDPDELKVTNYALFALGKLHLIVQGIFLNVARKSVQVSKEFQTFKRHNLRRVILELRQRRICKGQLPGCC